MPSRRHLPRLARIGVAVLCFTSLAMLASCGELLGPKEAVVRAYPDGVAGLQQMWDDVLHSAQTDDREMVHAIFKSLKMTRPELDRLFGPRAAELAVPYDEMMASFMYRGSVDIVATIYEKKYDRAEIIHMLLPDATVGDAPAVRADEMALARTLVWRPPLYSVRLKKDDEALGNRYDFLFYDEGHWRTGNQIGKVIAKRDGIDGANIRPPAKPKPAKSKPGKP
jgi:hypothetical protein